MLTAIGVVLLVVGASGAAPPAAAQEVARTTTPVLIREVKPDYTKAAREARIQGVVELSAVILVDGTVGDVTVTRSLDRNYGLDEEAVKALKQWRFKPGTEDGKPVAVTVTIEMTFTLGSPRQDAAAPEGTYRKGDAGITMPVVVKEVHPHYPAAALKAGISGTVEMQALVHEDGTVSNVTVTKSLDTEYGLDDAAVNALKQWVFRPGTKEEKPVRVLVDVQMSFSTK